MKDDIKYKYAGYWIRRFLCEYVVTVKNLSANTQKSYRDTFRLLLSWLSVQRCKDVDVLQLEDMSPETVKDFLNHIESCRNCSVRTRNQRLAAISALAKYVSINSPEHVEWCRSIRNIPIKKASRKLVTYLEKDEMQMLMDAPDKKTIQGWRDYVLLLFLYNTGARAEEAVCTTIDDISKQRGKDGLAIVTITGKGGKTRRCPLWKNTVDAIESLSQNNQKEEKHIFLNRCGQPMTRFGVYEMVRRYAENLEQQNPDLKRKRISPHTIRHTTATHLLQSGVDINTIRAWLGHVSINTTNIYAEVNMAMKEDALATLENPQKVKALKKWSDDKKLMDFLNSL